MSDDIKVLALRTLAKQREDELGKLFNDAADALEALAGEVERTKDRDAINATCHFQAAEINRLEAERDRLKAALVKIEQGDYGRSGRNFYNTTTRTPSKHDTCGHGKAYWDDCGNCCSSFARKALGDAP